ncbi:cytochrome b [Lichenihabitans psoromatis]|uniref:cytochrome b n=1 Tax=Lichenihabitans psoromatis TaxID=2528642 RepID=UPI0010359602|nr:cytochrome b [Lichenihabitans psoromatis]
MAEATRALTGEDGRPRGNERYDSVTMTLHWLTAILVVTLFSLAHIWSFFPHDGPTQITMQTAHVSLGVVLAAVLIVRLSWRSLLGRRLRPATTGVTELAAKGMHYVLYGLLITMAVAGFGKRWVRGHGVEFFGTSIPSPLAFDLSWRPAFNWVHHWGAWAIIVLAGFHAAAALFHHYAVRDGVLRRMLPGREAPTRGSGGLTDRPVA